MTNLQPVRAKAPHKTVSLPSPYAAATATEHGAVTVDTDLSQIAALISDGHLEVVPSQPDALPQVDHSGEAFVTHAQFGVTDILVIGSASCPLINGWTDGASDSEPLPMIYKQGGRAWMTGVIMSPGGNDTPFNIPDGYGIGPGRDAPGVPGPLGGDPNVVGAIDIAWPVTVDWGSTMATAEIGNGNPLSLRINPAPAAGKSISLDGISWPII